MKKVILLLMLLLPMGVGLQSCGDDDELSYYDQVLEEKLQMFREFKSAWRTTDKNGLIVVNGNVKGIFERVEQLEIIDGRYIEVHGARYDLLHLTECWEPESGNVFIYQAGVFFYRAVLFFE